MENNKTSVSAIVDCINNASKSVTNQIIITNGLDIKIRPIEWLWQDWLPLGKLTILAGDAGTGKTTLAISLAASITAGLPLPDGDIVDVGNVLIWSGEDSVDDVLYPRFIASGGNPKNVYFVTGKIQGTEKQTFDPAEDIVHLNEQIWEIGNISLLIVDPIINAVSGDVYRPNDVRRNLQPLVDFGEKHNCAIIGITHFGKSTGGRNPLNRVIGSQAFGALARMVLVVAKDENAERRVFARAKSNIAPDDGGFEYSVQTTLLPVDGKNEKSVRTSYVVWGEKLDGSSREILSEVEYREDDKKGRLEEAEDFLLSVLANGEVYQKKIMRLAESEGISERTIKRAEKRLGIQSRKGNMIEGWFWYLPN